MNTYDAYQIINLDEFEATGLISKKLTVLLGDLGQKEILVTKGNAVSILFDDVFLSVNLNGHNPFEFEDFAVFLDPENNIWLGIKVEN